ncbi:MAG: Hsp20/alpha crystallin family protein [Labilithrix sp.]|nr:Hsp20/alpha crystallin family protein [Labilithrix sp.]
MLSRLTDFDRTFDVLDELRRQMDRVWSDLDGAWTPSPRSTHFAAAVPRFNVFDAGASLVVSADVPGLTEKDLDVSLEDGVLTVSGERKPEAREGFGVHRRERGAVRFTRSLALPLKVDPEKATASVKDGVLTVTLAKAPEARPRQIAVRAHG